MEAVLLNEIIEKALNLPPEERQKLIRVLQKEERKIEPNGKKNPSPNIEWLKEHRNEVAGKYVALKNGKLVGQGRTIREADQEAKRNGAEKPLLTYVAREEEELWGGW